MAQNYLTPQKMSQYCELFSHFDYYKTGTITDESLLLILTSMNIQLNKSDLIKLCTLAGNRNCKAIELDEFLAIIATIIQDDVMDAEIEETFETFDADKSGTINHKDFEKAFKQIGLPLKKEEIQSVLKTSGKSEISYEDFHRYILKRF